MVRDLRKKVAASILEQTENPWHFMTLDLWVSSLQIMLHSIHLNNVCSRLCDLWSIALIQYAHTRYWEWKKNISTNPNHTVKMQWVDSNEKINDENVIWVKGRKIWFQLNKHTQWVGLFAKHRWKNNKHRTVKLKMTWDPTPSNPPRLTGSNHNNFREPQLFNEFPVAKNVNFIWVLTVERSKTLFKNKKNFSIAIL